MVLLELYDFSDDHFDPTFMMTISHLRAVIITLYAGYFMY